MYHEADQWPGGEHIKGTFTAAAGRLAGMCFIGPPMTGIELAVNENIFVGRPKTHLK